MQASKFQARLRISYTLMKKLNLKKVKNHKTLKTHHAALGTDKSPATPTPTRKFTGGKKSPISTNGISAPPTPPLQHTTPTPRPPPAPNASARLSPPRPRRAEPPPLPAAVSVAAPVPEASHRPRRGGWEAAERRPWGRRGAGGTGRGSSQRRLRLGGLALRHLASLVGHKRRRGGQWVRDPLGVSGRNGGALGRLQGPGSVETPASSSTALPAQNGRRPPGPLRIRYGRPGAAQTAALGNSYAYSRNPITH